MVQVQDERLLDLAKVTEMVGVNRSTIYNWIAAGRFPRPVQVGSRLVKWRQTEILAWLAELPKTS